MVQFLQHGYWKDHSFDYTDLCQQSDADTELKSAF